MLRNYLKIAIRNFTREKFYALINTFGLALGIASSLLIIAYISHETSYDTFHPDADRLYRVNQTNIWSPTGGKMSSSVLPLAGVLGTEYPEVEKVLRINTAGNNLVRYEGNGRAEGFYESGILAADSNFFEFFHFPLKEGDPAHALKGVNKVVISEAMATKYFGDRPALGKTLLFGEERTPMEVTGVTQKQPSNAHFNFDFLLSMYSNPFIKQFEWSWIWSQVVTYVKLEEGANAQGLNEKFRAIADRHVAPNLPRFGINYEDFIAEKGEWTYELQPVTDIHLGSASIGNRLGAVSDINYVYIFGATAILIILLAMINFVNLSTARASTRAKEVGVRKVMGSHKTQLVGQFLSESIMMCLAATFLALGMLELFKLVIFPFLSAEVDLSIWGHTHLIVMALGLPLLIGIVAGIYPAFYITSYQPAKVLKGNLRSGIKSAGFRNLLVVIQFTISIALMTCTLIVHQQLNYFNSMDMGFDKENVLVVNWAHKLKEQLESYKNEVKKHPNVVEVGLSMDMFGRGSYEDLFVDEAADREQTIAMMKADEDFLATMGLKMIQGRFFEKDRASDHHAAVINEATMRLFGWDEANVLGKRIKYPGDPVQVMEVIGVVKDFNHQSLRLQVAPYIFFNLDAPIWGTKRVAAIRYKGNDLPALVAFLEDQWTKMGTQVPFQYSFLDEEFKNMYRREERLGSLFATFTSFAIVIACLGLFGLASYTVNQRNKEIGIRKVLGASATRIMLMLNSNFSKLVIISAILAVPVALWATDFWLAQFAFKIETSWVTFFIVGILALLLAWVTVGYQALKAALSNPVEVLKEE